MGSEPPAGFILLVWERHLAEWSYKHPRMIYSVSLNFKSKYILSVCGFVPGTDEQDLSGDSEVGSD